MSISSGTQPDAIPPLTVSGSRLLGLKLGVPLPAVVEGPSETGWFLRVGGRLVEARSSITLLQGQRITVIASRTATGVSMRILGETDPGRGGATPPAQLGLPGDDIAAAVIRAVVRTGLGLKESRTRAIYRLAEKLKRSGKPAIDSARSASLMESKGMDLDADLALLIAGGTDSEEGTSRQDEQSRDKRKLPDLTELSDVVRHAFREAVSATHPLQLFNHLIGEGDHWLVVPIGASLGTETIRGTLRIRVPRGRAIGGDRDSFRYAIVSLLDGEKEKRFSLVPIGTESNDPPVGVSVSQSRNEAALRRRLEQLGFRMTVIGDADESFDGFSWGVDGDIMKSVNSSA